MSMRTGVVCRPQSPPRELRPITEAADAAGVDELWLWEDCFLQGGLVSAASALAWSTRLHVGIGLLPVPLRNPAVTAMEIAALAETSQGRFLPALGHGVLDWMGQVGARVSSPVTLLRETTAAVADLLAGSTVDVDGRYVHLERVRLDWPPSEVPRLLVGARGPKTVALAGEVGDGVLLDAAASPDDVRRARSVVDEARTATGRPGRADVTVYVEVDPVASADLAVEIDARIEEHADAGADAVVLQAPEASPDPRPIIEALASRG